jgi:hypothetical protein
MANRPSGRAAADAACQPHGCRPMESRRDHGRWLYDDRLAIMFIGDRAVRDHGDRPPTNEDRVMRTTYAELGARPSSKRYIARSVASSSQTARCSLGRRSTLRRSRSWQTASPRARRGAAAGAGHISALGKARPYAAPTVGDTHRRGLGSLTGDLLVVVPDLANGPSVRPAGLCRPASRGSPTGTRSTPRSAQRRGRHNRHRVRLAASGWAATCAAR